MTLPQLEHPEAVAEFDAAVHWYEEQEPGVGLALIDRAQRARHARSAHEIERAATEVV